MTMIISLLILVTASRFTKGSSLIDEERKALHDLMGPIVAECSIKHGVSLEDLRAATEAQNFNLVNPCFIGCIMKKSDIIDANGYFTPQNGLTKLRAFIQRGADTEKVVRISKKCSKVNDEPVDDGEAGCERAKLIVDCIMQDDNLA